jgi:hypothetical protein
VSVTLHEPRSGRVVDGRGGIAVAPGRAVRMILVGGAATTMLDAWVTPDRWRVAIPPVSRVLRGGADEPRDLPIGFLRWWFFRPLQGTLVAASPGPPAVTWLLHDGPAVVVLREGRCERGEWLAASRRVDDRVERLDACPWRPAPAPGDHVRYDDEASGLAVDLTVEGLASGAPPAEAFDDPDSVPGP